MPKILALPGAHLQLRGHHAPTASGGQTLPDHGPYMEKDHDLRQTGPQGTCVYAFHVEILFYMILEFL